MLLYVTGCAATGVAALILAYLIAIVSVNFMFAHTGPHIGALFVGLIFVLRDYVQQRIGHYVILPMLIGCGISYLMANPIVATASLSAFLIAELVDWGVYTSIKTEFHWRVFWSSAVGVLIDSLVFLPMIGVPIWPIAATAWCSKMVAAIAVYGWYQVRS